MNGSCQQTIQRVLVVDDDEDLAEGIAELLDFNGFAVAIAHNTAQAFDELNRFSPQVALVDLRLGQENGLDVMSRLRGKCPELICIVVTANTDKESADEALRREAYDYLIKPVDPNWLIHVVSRAFYVVRLNQENYRMIRQLQSAKEKAEELALSDSLTNLANRHAFQARLEEVVAQANESEKSAGLLFIDLDRFKDINDTYGHLTGDRVLKQIAVRLEASCRETDIIGRLGGDEFAIIIDELNHPEDICHRIKRVQECFSEPISIDNIALDIGASIGVSLCPDDGINAEELIRRADVALYASKAEGRGMSRRFDIKMDEAARAKRKLDADLKKALSNEEFELFYQPLINLSSQKVVGVEALLRWNHPELGVVTPDKFIDAAETSGLIVDIGEWVIASACRQMKAWANSDLSDIRMAVNISMRQLLDDSLADTIRNALDEFGVPPSKLELELTESSVNANEDQVNDQLSQLREMGVQIALDDFGTGYSSLTRLKNYPIDHLKIDRSFVRNLASDADDRFICMATMQLAQNLGLKTIAEGIESRDQLDFFRSMGCDEAQGYYFSEPLAIQEFEQWVPSYCGNRFIEKQDTVTAVA